ncbi:uncharacterized protein JCM6883_002543 [Sporobolomyces salmoneus]|uniref:uncharacterized protein n=1 Tax=Sporobolomyces salmoneus TaxID=183962 RepID=UPI00317A69FA
MDTPQALALGPDSLPPRLPPELLYKIFTFLPSHSPPYPKTASARSTLAVVCQTCSTFESIARPILWRSLDVKSRQDARALTETLSIDEERAESVVDMRLRTNQLLGPPNQNETSELVIKLQKLKVLRVEQRWFGLELLGGLKHLTHLYLLGPWSPSRLPSSFPPLLPLLHLRQLSITLHALIDLLDPSVDAHDSLVVFSSVETLSIHEAQMSISSWLPPRRTPLDRNLLEDFPDLSLISCPLSYKSQIDLLLPLPSFARLIHNSPPAAAENESSTLKPPLAILWRMNWQAFVDYMYPYRSFSIDSSLTSSELSIYPIQSTIQHLAFEPFSYSPVPDHFLLELINRIENDSSLSVLRTLWLDVGWDAVREGRREFDEVCERKGLRVRFVGMKGEGIEGWETRVEQEFVRGRAGERDELR